MGETWRESSKGRNGDSFIEPCRALDVDICFRAICVEFTVIDGGISNEFVDLVVVVEREVSLPMGIGVGWRRWWDHVGVRSGEVSNSGHDGDQFVVAEIVRLRWLW